MLPPQYLGFLSLPTLFSSAWKDIGHRWDTLFVFYQHSFDIYTKTGRQVTDDLHGSVVEVRQR